MDLDLTNIENLVEEFVYQYASRVLDEGHNASGNLVMTMKKVIQYDGKWLVISLDIPKYAIYLERGTKPHFPPIDAIKKWIKIKPVLPRAIKGKLPTENQLAYLIGRKISRVGTEPLNLIHNTMVAFDLENKIYNEILEQLNNVANKELEDIYYGKEN